MKATLFVIPGSHPSMAARLMLEAKGIEYRRIDLVPVISKLVLRAAGFKGVTVPALRIGRRKVQETGAIARALDEIRPEPPLVPADPHERARVEEAERWGDEVLQPVPRRVIWNLLSRDRRGARSYLEGARLGLPVGLAARTSAPIAAMSKRFNAADDEQVRRDLAALPELVAKADSLLADGVIGGEAPNVADYQIAASLRLLMTLDDTRPYIEGHPVADYALRLVPEFPGYAPAGLPAEWKPEPTAAATGAAKAAGQ
jgi:glutathione S-transferase